MEDSAKQGTDAHNEVIEATEVPERAEAAVREMMEAIKAYVIRIEGQPATTRNHYGNYMALIGAVEDRGNQRGLAESLIRVGANQQGVIDGFKAATGEEL